MQRVVTDGEWTAGPSAVLANDLYDGETIDARRRDEAWLRPGFAGDGWTGVHELEFDTAKLTPYIGPKVTRREEVPVQRIWTSPAGKTLVDFGQNLVGFVRVRVQGAAGTEIVLKHAEVLEHDELGTRPLRSAKATDRFVLSGGADEFEPTFTFHGFRYAEIEGWPGEVDASALTAVVIGSELDRIGTFRCSDDLLNRFHENVVWGMRGNFVDVPTDCPQRDERLGWTGDIAAFAPTAAFLFDIDGFLQGLAARPRRGAAGRGRPDPVRRARRAEVPAAPGRLPSAGLDGALERRRRLGALDALGGLRRPRGARDAVRLDGLARAPGARSALADGPVGHRIPVRRLARPRRPAGGPGGREGGQGRGLHRLRLPLGGPRRPGGRAARAAPRRSRSSLSTPPGCGPRSTSTTSTRAGSRATARPSTRWRSRSACSTRRTSASLGTGSPSWPPRRGTGSRPGSPARPFITDALTRTGHTDVAYRLLTEREVPSWLYPVTMGATTVWERWDSMLPDGTINPGEMTSFNHYALGAVADWMHRVVGGIAPAEPGYAKVLVAPQPGGGITEAETALATPHGRVAVAWRLDDDRLHVEVEVPEGVEAVVRLPGQDEQTVSGGSHVFDVEAAATAAVGAR